MGHRHHARESRRNRHQTSPARSNSPRSDARSTNCTSEIACPFRTMRRGLNMNRKELDNEWERVRVAPATYAADRYSWLRPASPSSIGADDGAEPRLFHKSLRRDGTWRFRALRVDEAHAVLDVQFAIDDLHPLDRSKMSMRRYYFHPDRLQLNLVSGRTALQLTLLATAQNLGVRFWWACPTCGSRRRYIYFFRLGNKRQNRACDGILGCRDCLGLTYRSRSRHRCDDQDRVEALDGDLKAATRALLRIDRKSRSDEVFVEMVRQRLVERARGLVASR
jgi:hypothetical protein